MIFSLPMCGSEVANSKTEIHLTNTAGEVGMRYHVHICDVTTIEREGDVTSLGICYCVWCDRGCQEIMQTDGGTKYPT